MPPDIALLASLATAITCELTLKTESVRSLESSLHSVSKQVSVLRAEGESLRGEVQRLALECGLFELQTLHADRRANGVQRDCDVV